MQDITQWTRVCSRQGRVKEWYRQDACPRQCQQALAHSLRGCYQQQLAKGGQGHGWIFAIDTDDYYLESRTLEEAYDYLDIPMGKKNKTTWCQLY